MKIKVSKVNQPNFKECNVHASLPAELSKLQEIAYNLWWCWNGDAKDLFRYIDLDAWHRAGSNPIMMVNTISYDRMMELTKDKKFLNKLNDIYTDFRA
jgi:starch phosphorylase